MGSGGMEYRHIHYHQEALHPPVHGGLLQDADLVVEGMA